MMNYKIFADGFGYSESKTWKGALVAAKKFNILHNCEVVVSSMATFVCEDTGKIYSQCSETLYCNS